MRMLVLARPRALAAPPTMRTAGAGAVALLALIVGYAASAKLGSETSRGLPKPAIVEVITEARGQAAEDIEHAITVPIETAVAGMPHVTAVRTISLAGMSNVSISFGDGFEYPDAERVVASRLSQLSPLPSGASPRISSQSPIGDIFRYRIVGPSDYSPTDFRTVQNWVLDRRFRAVPGVVDVSGWTGRARGYEITIDLGRLSASGLTLPQIMQAINKQNPHLGLQTVSIGMSSAMVRGVGPSRTVDDLRNTVLMTGDGAPIDIKDVATVAAGHQPRPRVGDEDSDNIVEGLVLTRGEEAGGSAIRRLETEVENINSGEVLPPGMRLVPINDRQS